MNILFNNSDGSHAYKLVKQDPGFELMRWDAGGRMIERGRYSGQAMKAGWRKMAGGNGLYPNSISRAIDLIAADQLETRTGDVDLKTMRRELTGYLRDLDVVANALSELAD